MAKKSTGSDCPDCGMYLRDQGEFHPLAFCVWKKAGLDPWETLLWINKGLGVDVNHWPENPPLIRDLHKHRAKVHA